MFEETGHARSGNGDMKGKNDTVSKVIVSHAYDRDYPTMGGEVKATFFDGMDCTGTS